MSSITPVAVFPIEGTPDWQVITEDSVWVTNGPKNTIHRLDTKTNKVVRAIEVGKRPEFKGQNVVVIMPDSGERYVSTPFFAP